ncbi:MAG: DUF512 domain-containing protein [Selenomonadaceae bacterium]|nr:DUF512 domain-containing protein [Selenomonadaceae bacterium]
MIRIYKGKIIRVHPNSLADELELKAGDAILAVNDHNPVDIIDLSFALADEEIELLIEHADGRQELIAFDKDVDEELGVEFESACFDGIRQCKNHCVFCFVDMIAPDMRRTLSIKDDDYRLSFLYGNFITLTNLTDADIDRIARLHLSPLFVSVHAIDPIVRTKMLRTKLAASIRQKLDRLEEAGIEYHTQIVLCRGLNDGEVLEQTIDELNRRRPHCLSLAIVPVGVTKHRRDPFAIHQFDRDSARSVIEQVERWQKKIRRRSRQTFVYLGDEFYLMAGLDVPPEKFYDGFPQLDNGIGLTRSFISDWQSIKPPVDDQPISLAVVSGTAFAPVLRSLVEEESRQRKNLSVKVIPVVNDFFGETVNVSGLLVGQDIRKAIRSIGKVDGILIPESALRSGEDIFLDDITLDELRREHDARIEPVLSGSDFRRALADFNSYRNQRVAQTNYTWQSNAAYSTPD